MMRDALARFAAGLDHEHVPAPVVAEVERLLVDHVASMLAGPRAYGAELPPLAEMVRGQGGTPESTLVGVPGRYPCTAAAFANTALGFTGCDAWHKPSVLHVPAALFSAAIAVAEREGSSGRDLLAALVAGAEIMIRAGLALGPRGVYARGFHPTSVCAPLGCAAAAGRLLGLDAPRMAEALSTAAVLAAGSSIWSGARTPATFCVQIGRAAESGVLAALLAARGAHGVDRIFEDPRGYLGCYSGESDPARLTAGLGAEWHVASLMMQRWWFGPYLLTSVETLIALMREAAFAPADLDAVEARIPTTCVPLVGAAEYPRNRLATVTTLRYALAVSAFLGEDGLYSMEVSAPARMADPAVEALFARIAVTGDAGLDRLFPEMAPCIVRVRARDGRELERRFDGPVRGDPADPMSDADVEAKFDAMAGPALPAGHRDPLIAAIRDLEQVDDVNALTAWWAA